MHAKFTLNFMSLGFIHTHKYFISNKFGAGKIHVQIHEH
jgi:hypothetical protein